MGRDGPGQEAKLPEATGPRKVGGGAFCYHGRSMSEPVFIVASILALLLGTGFFSGSEIAIITARRSRIETLIEEGSRSAERVRELQDNMDQFLATVQIGVTVMATLAGMLGGVLATRYIEPEISSLALSRWVPPTLLASALVGVVIVYVGLVFGELVPKAVALRYTETFALLVAGPVPTDGAGVGVGGAGARPDRLAWC